MAHREETEKDVRVCFFTYRTQGQLNRAVHQWRDKITFSIFSFLNIVLTKSLECIYVIVFIIVFRLINQTEFNYNLTICNSVLLAFALDNLEEALD